MNLHGVITHNGITLGLLLLVAGGSFHVAPAIFYLVAAALAAYWAVREAYQRRKDFPGIPWIEAFMLNWMGPSALAGYYRDPQDNGRSPWDWRLQGYGPAGIAAAAVLISLPFL